MSKELDRRTKWMHPQYQRDEIGRVTSQYIDELEAEVERLRDRTVYLEGLLLKYGEHQPGCNWNETNNPDDCDCGWSEQRAALEPREGQEEQ